jgi:hypothetical protein
MSIEDINYMKDNCIKQAYTFIIDSSDRDRNIYPNPNNYVIDFSTPFKNVIGMEIIDASIPRAMYTVDVDNNEIYYYAGRDNSIDEIADEIIANGMQTSNYANLKLSNSGAKIEVDKNSIYTSNLLIENNGYAILNNSINIYNIYNNENNIGGNSKGITFNIKFNPTIVQENITFSIINFSYNHTYFIDDNNPIYNNIKFDITKIGANNFKLIFTIGETIINIPLPFIQGNDKYINLYWAISDNKWCINYICNPSTSVDGQTYNITNTIYNVFYTTKYIGKGWVESNNLRIKHFKIYNTYMTKEDVITELTNNTVSPFSNNLPIMYDMQAENNKEVSNKGYNSTINYKDIFKKITIKPMDYNFNTFIIKYDELIKNNDIEFRFNETTSPPSLSNLIDIISKAPLIIDMKRSTLAENLGFDLYPTENNDRYIYKNNYPSNSEMDKMFQSRERKVNDEYYNDEILINNGKYIITSPGMVYFIGNKYIIMRCPEIEEHLYRSLSYSKYSLGLAKFRVDSIGINSEKLSITKIPVREFHPIGKLARLTLKFETNKGLLYDFKGINHNIIFAIFYYEPIQKNIPTNSILNPSYKMNYIDYQYKQEEIEGDSTDDDNDDTEDFSRDNIDEYKIKENLYNERGVKLQQFKNYYENNNDDDNIDNNNNDNNNNDDDNIDNNNNDDDNNDDDNNDDTNYY